MEVFSINCRMFNYGGVCVVSVKMIAVTTVTARSVCIERTAVTARSVCS